MAKRCCLPALILPFVLLASSCDDRLPTSPSSPVRPPPVQITDVFDITVSLVAADGGECVGDTMRSRMGVSTNYSLSFVPNGANLANVTLRSASGDYACTFLARMEGDEFSTVGVPGWYTCESSEVVRNYTCNNGSIRDMMRLGQNLSGRRSADKIAGDWHVSWIVMEAGGGLGGMDDIGGLETRSEFEGMRR